MDEKIKNFLPIPAPRKIACEEEKAPDIPTPLPRSKVEPTQEKINNSPDEKYDVNNFQRRLKGIKSASSSMQEKSLSVLHSTRKSVRNILNRQHSVIIRKNKVLKEKEDGRLSLPAGDIFDSIKFDFPLLQKSNIAFCWKVPPDTDDVPPPEYPPPPLPDMSIYDEVRSERSSSSCCDYSSSNCDSYLTESTASNQERISTGSASACDDQVVDTGSLDNSPKVYLLDIKDPIENKLSSAINIPGKNDHPKRKNSIYSSLSSDIEMEDTSGKSMEASESEFSFPCFSGHQAARSENYYELSNSVPLKSVILEFDPLYDNISKTSKSEISFDDDYNLFTFNASTCEQQFTSFENNAIENKSLLVSNLENISPKCKDRSDQRNSSSLTRWSSMKKVIKSVTDGHRSKNSSKLFQKPESVVTCEEPNEIENCDITANHKIVSSMHATLHNGFMYVSCKKSKDFTKNWCQLSEGKLSFSIDKSSPSKEFINLETILSIQKTNIQRRNSEGDDIHCFEINTSSRNRPFVFGAVCTTERRVWMQKILENLTISFPSKYTANYFRSGFSYLKEGINGNWDQAWILLHKRYFSYVQQSTDKFVQIDLRKARYIGMQDTEETLGSLTIKKYILLDSINQVLYLTSKKINETEEWLRLIRLAAVDNGVHLGEQQLTKDDIPVIVDKCVNFVCAHGSMSEGIYRRSGSNSNVTRLLSLFRQDAWSIQISRKEYTEYDVASVLKRFFRDLAEPLLPTHLHKHLCNVPGMDCCEEDKLSLYRSILEQLSPVNYVTLRKLISHLYFIHQEREKNLMNVENLAAVWGPTLMHIKSSNSPDWSKRECAAVSDLISLYPKLFLIDGEEVERENKIRDVLEKYHNSYGQAPPVSKPSGDLKIWIYLGSKENGNCVGITVNPTKSCSAVCIELADKMNCKSYQLCIEEHICGGSLVRQLHHSERIFDSVIRWSYWDDVDRKDNYLVITTENIIEEVYPLAKPPLAVSGELKYADTKSKSFKNCLFEFTNARLICYKDKKGCTVAKEWKIEDIVWYIGYEQKRNPHSRWAITFISKINKENRSKENPYFGWTIAGSNKEEQLRWMAAFLLGQYSHSDLLPPISLLN